MSSPITADFLAVLDALEREGVRYVLVGGLAAILHGAEITTRDVDIVPDRSDDNIACLRRTLEALRARVRDPAGRSLEPNWLDVLGVVEGGFDYEALVGRSELVEDERLRVRIVDLPTLIEIKTRLGRPRDRLALPLLIALQQTRLKP